MFGRSFVEATGSIVGIMADVVGVVWGKHIGTKQIKFLESFCYCIHRERSSGKTVCLTNQLSCSVSYFLVELNNVFKPKGHYAIWVPETVQALQSAIVFDYSEKPSEQVEPDVSPKSHKCLDFSACCRILALRLWKCPDRIAYDSFATFMHLRQHRSYSKLSSVCV